MRRAILLIPVLMFPACDDDAAQGPVEIEFQVSGDPEEIVVYESLVESFSKSHPGIDVKMIPVADKDDHLLKLSRSFVGGDPPDVFLVNFREYSQFAIRGALEPVGPHLDAMGLAIEDYFPQPIEAFTFEDELQCLPQNISSLVVYYNRALFRKAGADPPPDSWTWEEFRATAISLTDGDVRGVGIEPSIIRLAPFVWSNGGELVDDPDAPTRFTFDDSQSREALEFVVGLVRDDGVVPTEKEVVAAEDLETMFAAGDLAMLLSSRRDTPEFREIRDLKWDVAPLPTADERAGILHSDAYCIAAEADEIDAALEFVAFAAGEKGQTLTALGGRTVPSLKSVARSGAFLDPTQPPRRSEVFLKGIPYIRRTPVIPTWPEIEDTAEKVLTRAFYDEGYTIDDTIRDLDEETRPLFAEAAT